MACLQGVLQGMVRWYSISNSVIAATCMDYIMFFAIEGSTILLGCRTMLGECCLAAIQPKGFWTELRAQEREREYESITPDNEDKTVYQELYSKLLSYY
jgi:hypothetical protein